MFQGLSAWFSSSVGRKKKKLWMDNGGIEALFEDAQFVFSQDCEAADTKRVFDSQAYLEEHLSVFHPNYITECVKQGTLQHIVLGKYFFPPKDVQELARKQMQYQWDFDGNTSDGDTDNMSDGEVGRDQNKRTDKSVLKNQHNSTEQSTSQTRNPNTVCNPDQLNKSQLNQPNDYKSGKRDIENSKKEPSKQPSTSVYVENGSVEKSNKQNIRESPRKKKKLEDNSSSAGFVNSELTDKKDNNNPKIGGTDRLSPRKATPRKQDIASLKNAAGGLDKVVGSEVSEFLRLEEMAKVTGELQDFIVGRNGCEIVLE